MTTTLINTDRGYKPHVNGTRITVQQIAEYHQLVVKDVEQIAAAFRLLPAQVHAALAYYFEHQADIDDAIESDRAATNKLIPGTPYTGETTLMMVMTPHEVADQYRVSVEAVYQAIRRRRLSARQSGKAWLLLRQDAERLWGHKRA